MKTTIVNKLSQSAYEKLHLLVAKWNIKYAAQIAKKKDDNSSKKSA